MVMDLDVEQLLEAPFRKEQPKVATPVQAQVDTRGDEDRVSSEERRRHRDGSRDIREKRSRDRSRSGDRKRRSSRKGSKSRSRSRDRKRRSSKRDGSGSRSPRRRDDRERERRRRSRSSSRRRSRHGHSRDGYRRRSSTERSRRASTRDRSRSREATPELDEYERDKRTVFVCQLAARLREDELYDFFTAAGRVRSAKIITDRISRRSKGVGYVEFYEVDSVEKALNMRGQKLLGIPIEVSLTEAEKNRIAAEAEAAARAESSSTRLYIGSLHFSLTEDDLRAIFEPFGPIEQISLHKDPETGKSRGFAFLQYKNASDAKQAMDKMNGFDIMGRAIKVGHITDKVTGGASGYSLDDGEVAGLAMNNVSRIDLMAKLARDDSFLGGAPAKPVILPTRNILLKNMFNLQEMQAEGPNWDEELKEDVESECSKYGRICHVGVDTESPDGRIYLKYNDIPQAEKALNALNGRFFAGNQIEAAFVPDVTYHARFPEANYA